MTERLSKFSQQKLTELADIIERAEQEYARRRAAGEVPRPGAMFGYSQTCPVTYDCGAPGCAWGHWVAVHPADGERESGDGVWRDWAWPFGITWEQAAALFDFNGCDNAGRDAAAAVAFIRNAVEAEEL